MLDTKLTMQNPRASGFAHASKIWRHNFKGKKQKSEWNCQAEHSNRLPLAMINITLSVLLGVRSFKPDHSAMCPSFARPSKSTLSLDAFLLDTFQIDYLQAMTDGAVDVLSCYRPDSREIKANAATDALFYHPPSLALTFPKLALTFTSVSLRALLFSSLPLTFSSLALTYLSLILWSLTLSALCTFRPWSHCTRSSFRNICPITPVVRRVSKRASRQTYKASVGGVGLRLQGLLEKDNQGQIIRTR